MSKGGLAVVMWGMLGLGSCAVDDAPFLPLDGLCQRYADEVCSARDACCEASVDIADCERIQTQQCEAERELLVDEGSRGYDSRAAERRFDALFGALEDCQAPFAVASFFEGGLEEGARCERGAQCTSGVCEGDPASCLGYEPPLCDGADDE
jgi:hypothetical protein